MEKKSSSESNLPFFNSYKFIASFSFIFFLFVALMDFATFRVQNCRIRNCFSNIITRARNFLHYKSLKLRHKIALKNGKIALKTAKKFEKLQKLHQKMENLN